MRPRLAAGLALVVVALVALPGCRGEAPGGATRTEAQGEARGPKGAPAEADGLRSAASDASSPSDTSAPSDTAAPPSRPRTGPPPPWTLPDTGVPARRAFFGADGRHLIVAEAAGHLRVWDLERRIVPIDLVGHRAEIEVVTLARDGRTMVSAADDGSIELWFLEEGLALDQEAAGEARRPVPSQPFNPPVPLEGASGRILALAIDPGARRVLAGTDRGRGLLWAIDAPNQPPRILDHGAAIAGVIFDAEGARALTLGPGRAPRVWALDDPSAAARRLGDDDPARDLVHAAFASDGPTIALLDREGTLEIWDDDGGARRAIQAPPSAAPPPAGALGPFGALPIDAPAARIWPAEPERGAYAWPVTRRAVIVDDAGARLLSRDGVARALRLEGPPIDVAFAADGHRIATIEAGGRVRVWRTGGGVRGG
ncbi:MAG: hypothetical protein R3B09_14255 [Nannocystaceae bacterium]